MIDADHTQAMQVVMYSRTVRALPFMNFETETVAETPVFSASSSTSA